MLTLEERGAYADVISLIAEHVDELPNDDGYIAGWLRVHVRTWKRIRARLIGCEKLAVDGKFLRNVRATNECLLAVSKRDQAVTKGRKGGRVRWRSKERSPTPEERENNELAEAPAQAQVEAQLNSPLTKSSLDEVGMV